MKHKRGGIVFLIFAVLLLSSLLLFSEREKIVTALVQNFVDRVEKPFAASVSIERATFRFPFSLEVQNLSIQGDGFSLSVPQGKVHWNWISFFFGNWLQGKILLELDGGTLETGFRNPFDWFSSLTFSQWPPFAVVWRGLEWPSGRFLPGPLEVRLENTRDRFELGVKGNTWELQGFLKEKESVHWEIRTSRDKGSWKGNFDLKTSLIHVEGMK
ncbi:MAG: hypothetical protein ACP5Q4_03345, partial [Candidatus Caldatribacteriaceae bacterium]